MTSRLWEETPDGHGEVEWVEWVDGEPDIEAALAALRSARPEWTEFIGDPFVVEAILDAALSGQRIVKEEE